MKTAIKRIPKAMLHIEIPFYEFGHEVLFTYTVITIKNNDYFIIFSQSIPKDEDYYIASFTLYDHKQYLENNTITLDIYPRSDFSELTQYSKKYSLEFI
ncbi:MAG: hypothetical protein ACR2PH_05515 [Desulfobulbia bacterium]